VKYTAARTHSDWSQYQSPPLSIPAGSQSRTSAVIDPARLTATLRPRLRRRRLMVTPPRPCSTISEGWPNAFNVRAWPSSCTRIDTKVTTTQAESTVRSMPPSTSCAADAPKSTAITKKTGSTRTGIPNSRRCDRVSDIGRA
jgi:hypothetical protein